MREPGLSWYSNIADESGRAVRQLDASLKAGLHRTAWDLRVASPGAPRPAVAEGGEEGTPPPRPPVADAADAAEEAEAGGGFARSGPLVKPGKYTLTPAKWSNGQLTPLGQPQTVENSPRLRGQIPTQPCVALSAHHNHGAEGYRQHRAQERTLWNP